MDGGATLGRDQLLRGWGWRGGRGGEVKTVGKRERAPLCRCQRWFRSWTDDRVFSEFSK